MTTEAALVRAKHYQQVSSLYTNNGWDRICRHYTYIKTPGLAAKNDPVTATALISVCAFGGAKLGKYIGSEAEKAIYRCKQGFVGGMIGASVGFVAGGAVGGCAYMIFTDHNPSFQKWRKDGLTESVKLAITFSYCEDELLQHFTCPVSLCIMDVPTHTPSGIFYDMSFIMNCARESNGDIKDPNRNASFPESEAMPDFEKSFIIHKKIQSLLQSDLAALANTEEVGAIVHKQLAEVGRTVENRYENARQIIENRRRTKAISHGEYKMEIAEFEGLFGTDWEHDLDWNLDWLTILNQRWINFHPDAQIAGYN